MTEKDYLKMIAEGDKEAFRVIFDKYYPKVLAFLSHFSSLMMMRRMSHRVCL